jgi:hypothetical protein
MPRAENRARAATAVVASRNSEAVSSVGMVAGMRDDAALGRRFPR